MANTTTGQFKRRGTPIIAAMAVISAVLVSAPLFINPSGINSAQETSEATERALAQPIYVDIARAAQLLDSGQAESAGAILDSKRTEPLLITSGGYAEGVMAEDSPT